MNHGHASKRTRIYETWKQMRRRVNDPTHHRYQYYGAKGITICERWDSFINFLEDMGERPEGKTLDRIDSDKNYCPENCRWATPTQQTRNRSNTLKYTHDGVTKPLAEWAEIVGLPYSLLKGRIRHLGHTLEHAVSMSRPVTQGLFSGS